MVTGGPEATSALGERLGAILDSFGPPRALHSSTSGDFSSSSGQRRIDDTSNRAAQRKIDTGAESTGSVTSSAGGQDSAVHGAWVVELIGDLGTGKTQLVRGLARGIG